MPPKRRILWYHPSLKEKARKLRNNSTLSEVLLWNQLKKKQLMGYDFHRQKPIDYYIVDFFSNELNLVIEIDGITHEFEEQYKYDVKRQEKLEGLGINFLKFKDTDVREKMDGVLSFIKQWIVENR